MTVSSTPPPASDRQPFWNRIAADLTDAIARGTYAPGARLPSEHALAEQFGVNRHTIRRSLASLCSQGLLRATQGSGTYVEPFAVDLVIGRRPRNRHNLALNGLRGGMTVLEARTVRANAEQARMLRLAPRTALRCLRVLGEAEGQPYHVGERCFPLPRFAELEAVLRETGSISAGFAAHGVTDYVRIESRISACMPDARVATELRQPATRPVLRVDSVNADMDGVPIEFSVTWHAGDRVTLSVAHDDTGAAALRSAS